MALSVRTHIDWITFTLPMWFSTRENATYEDSIEFAFTSTFTEEILATAFGGAWQRKERSRAPYTNAWEIHESGITVFASQSLNHCCVEISGQGCERLIDMGAMDGVLTAIQNRVARIDIATDIETETKPTEFVAEMKHKRMRASGFQRSETGETCYIGSQKSDRYARVYRYFSPHPRAKLLRIETVFRKEYAKIVAAECLRKDISAVAKAAGDAFGFSHSDWNTDDIETADISVIAPDRATGNTVRWLITAAAPAFRRLVDEGKIRNAEEFLRDYFLSDA